MQNSFETKAHMSRVAYSDHVPCVLLICMDIHLKTCTYTECPVCVCGVVYCRGKPKINSKYHNACVLILRLLCLVVWAWKSDCISLNLSFFIYKMELIPVIFSIEYVWGLEKIIHLKGPGLSLVGNMCSMNVSCYLIMDYSYDLITNKIIIIVL